jgi:TetR/AcrR family transcriptional regulator
MAGMTADRAADQREARRQEILAVATRLFAENGYANTTMTGIAKACGLRQPSLYYWFRRKEHILGEVLALNRLSLAFVERIREEPGTPALRLYRLLQFDTHQLCLSPLDVSEVERMAEQQPEAFGSFWEDTAALHAHSSELVREGTAQGEFVECDPELVALNLCSASQGVQRRYRHAHGHTPGGPSRFRHPQYPAERIAEELAAMSVRSLLRRPDDLAGIRAAAARFDDLTAAASAGALP